MGIVFSFVAAFSCEFIKYDHSSEEGDDESSLGYAGLFGYREEDTGECVGYERDLDKSEKFAKDASLVAPIAASFALLIITLKLCWTSCKGSRLLVNTSMLVAIISQGITFAFFNSDEFCDGDILNEILHQDPCKPGKGSAFSILALFCYFFAAVAYWCVPKTGKEEEGIASAEHDVELSNKRGGRSSKKSSGTYT